MSSVNEKVFILNPYLKAILCNSNELLVKHGSRSPFSLLIQDENRTKLLGKILRKAQVPTSLVKLVASKVISESDLPKAESLVNYLFEQNVLVKPSYDVREIYLRTILGSGSEVRKKEVGIIGAGYLGARIAKTLLKSGIGAIHLLDARRIKNELVELYYLDAIPSTVKVGHPYVTCFAEYFSVLGFKNVHTIEADFNNRDRVLSLFETCHFVVFALEFFSPNALHTANEVALTCNKPWMSVYFDGSEALIGPTYVPGDTPCYSEFEIQQEACVGLKDEYLLYKEHMEEKGLEETHLVPPSYLETAAGYAATSALHFLSREESFTTSRTLRLDFERLSLDFEDVLKLPRCPACNVLKPAYRQVFL